MRPITAITQFVQEMSVAVDHGHNYSIEEVEIHIENSNLFQWLRMELQGLDSGVDLSMFQSDDVQFIQGRYKDFYEGYAGEERRKWGIENNGICLLISWGTEIIRYL